MHMHDHEVCDIYIYIVYAYVLAPIYIILNSITQTELQQYMQ